MSHPPRAQLLQELQSSQDWVIALLASMAAVQDWQPEPAEWSFRFFAAHLAAVERNVHLHRVRRIASGETPLLSHYENQAASFAHVDLADSLAAWVAARQELVRFVSALSESQLALVGIHEMVGPITLLDMLEEILEQDQANLRHVLQLILAYQEETQKNCV
jgi:hypothetical protein